MRIANILETYNEVKDAMMRGNDISFEICTAAENEQAGDKASDKLSQYRIGEPYSINGKIVGIISAMTIINDKVYVQVTALDDLCNGNYPDKISRLKSRIKHLLDLQANQDKEVEKLRNLLWECEYILSRQNWAKLTFSDGKFFVLKDLLARINEVLK